MNREILFRAWDKINKQMVNVTDLIWREGLLEEIHTETYVHFVERENCFLMQYTGLKDKNGKKIFEGDIVGEESVYHFIERDGWKPEDGNWKIIGEKSKNFTGKGEEKYIAGYDLSIVEWVQSSCGYEPFSDSKDNCGHCGGGRNPRNFEIIGSIHENPELLEGDK